METKNQTASSESSDSASIEGGTIALTIHITKPVETYLHRLLRTGLYGKNLSEAAERLICSALEKANWPVVG